jgi:hypothetical protein
LFTVVSFANVAAPKKTIFDPAQRRDFPAGMKVAAERAPRFSDDMQTVFFGIKEKRAATTPLVAAAAATSYRRVHRGWAARSINRA